MGSTPRATLPIRHITALRPKGCGETPQTRGTSRTKRPQRRPLAPSGVSAQLATPPIPPPADESQKQAIRQELEKSDPEVAPHFLEQARQRYDDVWRITPFIDFAKPNSVWEDWRWEREWRVPGGLRFKAEDVAFLFLPEESHKPPVLRRPRGREHGAGVPLPLHRSALAQGQDREGTQGSAAGSGAVARSALRPVRRLERSAPVRRLRATASIAPFVVSDGA